MTRDGHKAVGDMKFCKPLVMKLRRLLANAEGSKRAMTKEYFLRDLRNIREKMSGKQLRQVGGLLDLPIKSNHPS